MQNCKSAIGFSAEQYSTWAFSLTVSLNQGAFQHSLHELLDGGVDGCAACEGYPQFATETLSHFLEYCLLDLRSMSLVLDHFRKGRSDTISDSVVDSWD